MAFGDFSFMVGMNGCTYLQKNDNELQLLHWLFNINSDFDGCDSYFYFLSMKKNNKKQITSFNLQQYILSL